MKERGSAKKKLAGQLLLAHPALREPTFKRTVILLSSHDAEGALGVVLNRPLNQQLGEISTGFALGPLAGVPVFQGGPVATDQLLLVSWQWLKAEAAFQLHFGLDPEKAAEQIGAPGLTIRAFFGYAGWGQGQLENEMRHDTWIATPVDGEWLGRASGVELWRGILGSLDPDLKFLAGEPDDPSLN